ncbi:MAG: hypothetical protein RI894_785 [Bacteroidota bacterium]|jgi:hypothetical protein
MKTIFRVALLFLLGLVLFYTMMPVLNFGFSGIGSLLLILYLASIALRQKVRFEAMPVIEGHEPNYKLRGLSLGRWDFVIIAFLLLYIFVIPFVTSAPIFHSARYRELMGEVKTGADFSKHIAPISLDQVRVVDEDLAALLGDKIIGSQSALGSKVHLGSFTIQKVGNGLFWVAPLIHSGFFKWFSNQEGSTGYVMVSATDERDVRLVQEANGKPVHIRYQSGAYFLDYLPRYLYWHGYMTTGLTDYTFEIDDNGTPFWVVTTYTKRIGFSGNDATGVITMNAATGEIAQYGISDAPAWIDRIQPADFINEQLDSWGEYVHGYWNFSNEGKLTTTQYPTLVYGENNKSYWYAGLTSVGADESTVGFVLVDTRTKQATYYRQGGATEKAAQHSAEGKVQEKGYRATFPTPYNINGVPTYLMTLKDNAGLVKMFAMVAIGDYTTVGVGNTLQESLFSYKNGLTATGNKINAGSEKNQVTLNGTVSRITADLKNGMSYYYFMLRGSDKIFIGTSQLSVELPLTREGDAITILFNNDNEAITNVDKFDNTAIGLSKNLASDSTKQTVAPVVKPPNSK